MLPFGRMRAGDAKLTGAYRLPARHVIHSVGPVWRGGGHGEDELLARCYRRSVEVAAAHDLRTVAFPSISTGAFRFPLERAAGVAVGAVRAALAVHPGVREATFVCFGSGVAAAYLGALEAAGRSDAGAASPA